MSENVNWTSLIALVFRSQWTFMRRQRRPRMIWDLLFGILVSGRPIMTSQIFYYFSIQVSISPIFYTQLLHAQIPKAQKRLTIWLHFFAILGSERVKAARKILLFHPGDDTDVLSALFSTATRHSHMHEFTVHVMFPKSP